MATDMQDKPSIESIVNALKSQIPNCQVTDQEVADLAEIYPNVAYKDIKRLFYQAIRYKSMQPISFINRQLAIIHPSADPFNRQGSKQLHTYDGRKVESGTNWSEIYAKTDAERIEKRVEYDRAHGENSFEKKEKEESERLRDWFKNLEEETKR